MNAPCHLIEDGRPTGPHSLLVLHQKAEVHAITPDTLVRPASPTDAPWRPIREHPELHALLFPPRAMPALSVRRPAAAATASPFAPADGPIDVQDFLQDNTARLVASERLPRRPGLGPRARRHRAYLFTLLFAAVPAWAAYHFGLVPRSEAALVALGSAGGLVALLGYWFIYHVSDFRS